MRCGVVRRYGSDLDCCSSGIGQQLIRPRAWEPLYAAVAALETKKKKKKKKEERKKSVKAKKNEPSVSSLQPQDLMVFCHPSLFI